MNASQVQSLLMTNYRQKSQYAPRRDYLGMSGVGGCPREWYFRAVGDTESTQMEKDRMAWYSMVGYALEDAVVKRLGGFQARRSLVADFDSRYKGHTDHELRDGTLIEVKTVYWEKFLTLQDSGVGAEQNVAQCQAYMRHGDFPHAVLVYTPRDIPHNAWTQAYRNSLPFWCADVPRDEAIADRLDGKAKRVLAAMNANVPPMCTCGYCKK